MNKSIKKKLTVIVVNPPTVENAKKKIREISESINKLFSESKDGVLK